MCAMGTWDHALHAVLHAALYPGGYGERALFAGGAGGAGGDTRYAALCTGSCGGWVCLLEVLEVLEALDVLDMPGAVCCVLLCMLEVR
jgi:hypothetical protein